MDAMLERHLQRKAIRVMVPGNRVGMKLSCAYIESGGIQGIVARIIGGAWDHRQKQSTGCLGLATANAEEARLGF